MNNLSSHSKPSASPKTASPTTSMEPTKRPTTRNPSYDKVYEYTTEGSPDCIDKDGVVKYQNDQGPPPDVFDTVLQFLAFGMYCLCISYLCLFFYLFKIRA